MIIINEGECHFVDSGSVVLILCKDKRHCLQLEGIACEVWREIQGKDKINIKTITAKLLKKFEVQNTILEKDILKCIETLAEEKIISIVE